MTADPLLVETVDRLLADLVDDAEIERAENDGGWSATVWSALAEAGFHGVGLPEDRGGSGGSSADAVALAEATGRHAAPIPLAETVLVAGPILTAAGFEVPDGALTAVATPAVPDGDELVVDGPAAFGRHAAAVVVVTADDLVAVADTGSFDIRHGASLAGEARDHLTGRLTPDGSLVATVPGAARRLRLAGATSRAVLSAAALERVAELTVDYTHERSQFGRPVARFQAVQQHLVLLAQSAVRARMAADLAVRDLLDHGDGSDVAAARVVVDDAVTVGTRAAHQAHGAMGVTREYPLHRFTRRLWAWRHDWGTAREWRAELGRAVVAAGPDELYSLIDR